MELTKLQKMLIQLLKEDGATEDTVIGVMLLLDNSSKQKAMLDWKIANPKVTMVEIVDKAMEIKNNR